MDDPDQSLSPSERTNCIVSTPNLPEITKQRPILKPELNVYAAVEDNGVEQAMIGIADAIRFDSQGKPFAVIDRKNDVGPTAVTIEHYCAQIHTYLDMTDIERELVVLVTSDQLITIQPSLTICHGQNRRE